MFNAVDQQDKFKSMMEFQKLMLYQIKSLKKKEYAQALQQLDVDAEEQKPKKPKQEPKKGSSHAETDKDKEDDEISESLEKLQKTIKGGKKKKKGNLTGIEK